jgi:hypothetical protein
MFSKGTRQFSSCFSITTYSHITKLSSRYMTICELTSKEKESWGKNVYWQQKMNTQLKVKFSENPKFSWKYWYSKHFRENFRKCSHSKHFPKNANKNLRFPNIFVKDTFSEHCHVLAVLSRLPIGRLVQSDLSLLSCPSCLVPDVLSKTSCPDSSVLSRLSCPSCPPVAAALPRPHWPLLS